MRPRPLAGGPHQPKGAFYQHRPEPSDFTASQGGAQSYPVRHLPSRPPRPQARVSLPPSRTRPPRPPRSSSISRRLPISGPLLDLLPPPGGPSPSLFSRLTPTHPSASAQASPPCRTPPSEASGKEKVHLPACPQVPGGTAEITQRPPPVRAISGETRSSPGVATRGRCGLPASKHDAVLPPGAQAPRVACLGLDLLLLLAGRRRPLRTAMS